MTWFFIALLAPLFYTAANYIDKYVLSRFVGEEAGVGGVVIFSSLFGVIMIPISFFIDPGTLSIPDIAKFILVFNGMLSVTSLVLYLSALQRYDTSSVVPLYQLVPVFSYALGYLILGETLTAVQALACVLIILGAFVLSLQLESGKIAFKANLLVWMGAASFFMALTGVIFKRVALEMGYWQSQFWEYCGIFALGVILLLLVGSYRRDFLNLYRASKGRIMAYSSATEAAMISGDLLFNFSVLLAPVALVYVVNSFQPVFVLIFGLVLSWLLPSIYPESWEAKNLVRKSGAIALMIIGAILLSVYG